MPCALKKTDFTELEVPAIGTSDTDGGGGVDEVQRVQGDLDLRHPWSSEAELRTPGRKKYSDTEGPLRITGVQTLAGILDGAGYITTFSTL